MFTTIVTIVIVVVAAVLALAASKPGSFRVVRAAEIKAPPAKVFALIDDFHEWPKWSPWEKMDPAMTRTHSGAASGKGAAYAWVGNKKVGEGRMEITSATAPASLTIKLDFMKPFEAHNTTEFTLEPMNGGTVVTWAMTGASPFMFKLMGLFTSMDKMIVKDFEQGLASMKQAAEG